MLGNVAGKDVTEVAGWDRHFDGSATGLLLGLKVGIKIIDDLGQNPRPVDGVNSPEGVLLFVIKVAENFLYDRLSVVKGPFHGQIKDVGVGDGRHL